MGGRGTGSNLFPNYFRSERSWEAHNQTVERNFSTWLDSSSKEPFQIDRYNTVEKLSLKEVREWLNPNGYYNNGVVADDESWYIRYKDGTDVYLSEGDSLQGIKRSNILFAINSNPMTQMVYGKSADIEIENHSDYKDYNDIFMVDERRRNK